MRDTEILNLELTRLMRVMQTASFAIEGGHVLLALPTLLAPVLDAANNLLELVEVLPGETFIKASRDVRHQAHLDAHQVPTDLTVPEDWI